MTPGYYTVSFSAYGLVGPNYDYIDMYLYKNGIQIPESGWYFGGASSASDANDAGVVGSRIVVSNISDCLLNFEGFHKYLYNLFPRSSIWMQETLWS